MESSKSFGWCNYQFKLLKMGLNINIIDSLPVAIFWKDLLGKYLGCNVKMAKLLGYQSAESVIGKKDQDLIWSRYSEELKSGDNYVIANKKVYVSQEQVITQGDKTTLLLTSKAPLEDKKGKMIGVIGTMLDLENNSFINFNMELINQMVQNSRSLALQQIKHDIRSPLTGIIALGEFISSSNLKNTQELSELITHLGEASASLNKFLDSLSLICEKSLFTPQSNSLVDLNDIIISAVNLAKPSAILKNLILQTQLDEELIICSNEHKLFRIIMELISNAIKYTKSGEIRIIGHKIKDSVYNNGVKVEIMDTGFGMPQNSLDILNQPNNVINIQYEELEKGSGFGLGMIKSTAKVLDIDINAAKTGKGTTITLYIKSNSAKLYK